MNPFQRRVGYWMAACFPRQLWGNMTQRIDRFLEEAIELAQALGYDRTRVATLVDYVYGRPAGDPKQEVGGVMVTLAALCYVAKVDLTGEAEREMSRIEQPEVMEKIRRKQAMKNELHFDSPLPGPSEASPGAVDHLRELRAKVRRNAEGYAQANADAKVAECRAQESALDAAIAALTPAAGGVGEPDWLRDLRQHMEHCVSAAAEGEDFAVPRDVLDAMTTLGLMEKVGRGKWAPTDAGEQFAASEKAATLPIEVRGTWYEVPIAVHLRIISLQDALAALSAPPPADAVRALVDAEAITRHAYDEWMDAADTAPAWGFLSEADQERWRRIGRRIAAALSAAPVGYDDGTGRVRDWTAAAPTPEGR